MTDTNGASALLSAFDAAVEAELPRVSSVPYNSHDICKWFAQKLRDRLAALALSQRQAKEPPVDDKSHPRFMAGYDAGLKDGKYSAQEQAAPVVPVEPKKLRGLLLNLLAVIHGDGGQHTDEHGLIESVEHAEKLVADWRAEASHGGGVEKPRRLIGWRTDNFLWETSDPKMAKNWEPHHTVLPIFEGDPNTKLETGNAD